ncbi:MAG: metallophosphoesterase [Clostridiales bacterium]|nr:metallophosphoesterase [Clostridiales bacterium]
MKRNRWFTILMYIPMLAACICVIWLLGRLSGKPGDGGFKTSIQVEESTDESDDMPESRATASDAQSQEQDALTPEEKERQRQEWIEEYKKQRKKQLMGEKREAMAETTETENEPYVPPTIMLASDLHYISAVTHDSGTAFWKMAEGDDGKIDQYSDEMIDALMDEAIRKRPAALVLSGDLTLNGERENHEHLAEKLRRVQAAGVPVVVITGNHDILVTRAANYFGNQRVQTEYLHTANDFYEIYHEFGYDQSPNRDPCSLSFVYPVDAGHWLIMLDSCQYEDYNHVNGRLKPETLAWLEAHLKVAEEHGIEVLPIAHHNILSESRLHTTECTMENHDEVVELLEKYRVPLYISGHLHVQRIKKHKAEPGVGEDTYGITEIVLAAYPIPQNQYGELCWNPSSDMVFYTKQVDVAAYAAQKGLTDERQDMHDWKSDMVSAKAAEP